MLEAKFYETYYFCNVINNVLRNQFDYLRKLNEFDGDGRYLAFIEPFKKYSVFHSFIEFLIEEIYYENIESIDLEQRKEDLKKSVNTPIASKNLNLIKLPVESAFDFYNAPKNPNNFSTIHL